MGWVRLDDGYAEHPKVVGLSDAALAMEVRGLCYTSRQGTDGFVPDASLHLLTRSAAPAEVVAELVAVGRWERDDVRGGFWIHGYGDHHPTSRQRDAKRAAAAERMRRLRSRSRDVRANSDVTSREVRAGGASRSQRPRDEAGRSRDVRANSERTRPAAPPASDGPAGDMVPAELAPTGPLSSDDATASPNGAPDRSRDVRANIDVTSREVTRNVPRSDADVRAKFAFSPTPREPLSRGSLGVKGEGVVGQPGGPSGDPPPPGPGDPGSPEWEAGRRVLVARMLARGETPRHATADELAAWRATGRLPWDDPPATAASASPQPSAASQAAVSLAAPTEGDQP